MTEAEAPAEGAAGRGGMRGTDVLAAGAMYLAAAWAAKLLTVPGAPVAAAWVPLGVQVAVYSRTPTRRWAALTGAFAVGNVLYSVTAAYPLALAVAYLPVDLAEGLLGGALVRRLLGPEPRVLSVRRLVALHAALVTASAAGGLASAIAASGFHGLPLPRAFVLWWAGDALGALLIAPAVLALPPGPFRPARRRVLEACALAGVTFGSALLVHLGGRSVPRMEFVLVPAWLWAALRFGIPAVGAVGAIHAAITLLAIRTGVGALPRTEISPIALSVYLQALLGIELGAFQILAAAMEDRRRALAEARTAKEHFLALLRYAPLLGFLKDSQKRIVAVSEAYAAALGVPATDLIGKTNPEQFPPEIARKFDEEDERVLREGGPIHVVDQFRGRLYETTKFRFERADGEPLVCGLAIDVTERRASEATGRMAALGTLAAGMAHEINNPLAFVLANVSFAAERIRAQPRSRALDAAAEALDEAIQGAERVRDIVRDLRSFARPPDEGADAPLDLRSPLRAALTMARNEVKHRAAIVEDLREAPKVLANEHKLAQVLLNLIVNAAQAIPEDRPGLGTIRLRTGRMDDGSAFVEVEDDGRGMTDEERRRAFDPFYTTKPVGIGLGLGLFISSSIVSGYGGRIEVESAPGRGSTFRVVLPAAAEAVPPVRSGAEEGRPAPCAPHPLRVLVVDDEPLVGRSVARLLGKEHRVETITDARTVIERVRSGERWDVLLCDLMMPQLSGMELDERLAELAPELRPRTIYVTGGAFTERAQQFLDAPGRRVLQKPFDRETLRAAIADFRAMEDVTPVAG